MPTSNYSRRLSTFSRSVVPKLNYWLSSDKDPLQKDFGTLPPPLPEVDPAAEDPDAAPTDEVDPAAPVDADAAVDPDAAADPAAEDPAAAVDPTAPVDPTAAVDADAPVDSDAPVDPDALVDPATADPVDPAVPIPVKRSVLPGRHSRRALTCAIPRGSGPLTSILNAVAAAPK